MDGARAHVVEVTTGALRSTAHVRVLARTTPASIRVVTLDGAGREAARSNDLVVKSETHPAFYRLDMRVGRSGLLLAPLGERRVFARVEEGGARLTPGEAVPSDPGGGDVLHGSARLHRGRGVTALGAGVVYAWAGEGWRVHRHEGMVGAGSISLDRGGHAIAFADPVVRARDRTCAATVLGADGARSLSFRWALADWGRLRLSGCEGMADLDAGGDLWVAWTEPRWFFESRAAYALLLEPDGGVASAVYRKDFAVRAVLRGASGRLLVVGSGGDILHMQGRRRRWVEGRRAIRAAVAAAGSGPWTSARAMHVFGADGDGEEVVLCVGLYEEGLAKLLAEAVVTSADGGETWAVRVLAGADPAVPSGVFCDVAYAR